MTDETQTFSQAMEKVKARPKVDDIIADMMNSVVSKRRPRSDVKGGNWERALAKALTQRFGFQFAKTQDSGARATMGGLDKRTADIMTGDIIVPDDFRFCLEAKKGYSKIDLINLVSGDLKKPFSGGRRSDIVEVLSFIAKAKRDADRLSRDWMVIWRKDNNRPVCIMQLPPSEVPVKCDGLIRYTIVRSKWQDVECMPAMPEELDVYFYPFNEVFLLPDDFWYLGRSPKV